jgi:hypothetical protein
VNLIEPVATASFGAGTAATAGILLGMPALWIAVAALTGALVAVLVLAKALAAQTAAAQRASAAVATLGLLAISGIVAALRLPAQGSGSLLAWELAKVVGLMLAGGLGVAGAVLGLVAGAGALLSRRRHPRGEPGT